MVLVLILYPGLSPGFIGTCISKGKNTSRPRKSCPQSTSRHFGFLLENYLCCVTIKFTSQELDEESQLYYFNARYYDATLGSFLTADSIVPDPDNAQAYNRYAYVLNNPIRYIDPTGHFYDPPGANLHDVNADMLGEEGYAKAKAQEDTLQNILDNQPPISPESLNQAQDIAFDAGIMDCADTCILVGQYLKIPGFNKMRFGSWDSKRLLEWAAKYGRKLRDRFEAQRLADQGELVIMGLSKSQMPAHYPRGHVMTNRPGGLFKKGSGQYKRQTGDARVNRVMSRAEGSNPNLQIKDDSAAKAMNVEDIGRVPDYYHIPRSGNYLFE